MKKTSLLFISISLDGWLVPKPTDPIPVVVITVPLGPTFNVPSRVESPSTFSAESKSTSLITFNWFWRVVLFATVKVFWRVVAPATSSNLSNFTSSSTVNLSLKVPAEPTSNVPNIVAEVPTCIFSVIDAPLPTTIFCSNVDIPETITSPIKVDAAPTNKVSSSWVARSTVNEFSNNPWPFPPTVKSSSIEVIPVTFKGASIVEPAPVALNPWVNSDLWKKLEIPNTIISPWNLEVPLTWRWFCGSVRPIPIYELVTSPAGLFSQNPLIAISAIFGLFGFIDPSTNSRVAPPPLVIKFIPRNDEVPTRVSSL